MQDLSKEYVVLVEIEEIRPIQILLVRPCLTIALTTASCPSPTIISGQGVLRDTMSCLGEGESE